MPITGKGHAAKILQVCVASLPDTCDYNVEIVLLSAVKLIPEQSITGL
jgi:hypothetical protein